MEASSEWTSAGNKLTFKNMVGVGYMEWITEEEAAAIEAAKEPMEAPSHPYKEQPDNPGKLLWITGPPGLGKSTTAQLLAKTAGYVYYEVRNTSRWNSIYFILVGRLFWHVQESFHPAGGCGAQSGQHQTKTAQRGGDGGEDGDRQRSPDRVREANGDLEQQRRDSLIESCRRGRSTTRTAC